MGPWQDNTAAAARLIQRKPITSPLANCSAQFKDLISPLVLQGLVLIGEDLL